MFTKAVSGIFCCVLLTLPFANAETFKIGWISTTSDCNNDEPQISSLTGNSSRVIDSANTHSLRAEEWKTFTATKQPPYNNVAALTTSMIDFHKTLPNNLTTSRILDNLWSDKKLQISRNKFFQDHTFEFSYIDTFGCDSDELGALNSVNEFVTKQQPHAIITSTDDEHQLMTIGYLTAATKTLHLAFDAVAGVFDEQFSDSSVYGSMVRLSPTVDRLSSAFNVYMTTNGWTRVALLSQSSSPTCTKIMLPLKLELTASTKFDVSFVKLYSEVSQENLLEQDLFAVSQVARANVSGSGKTAIIYCFDDDEFTFRFLQIADAAGMSTSEYTLVQPMVMDSATNVTHWGEKFQAAGLAGRAWNIVLLGLGDMSQMADTTPNSSLNATNMTELATVEDEQPASTGTSTAWSDAINLYVRAMDNALRSQQQKNRRQNRFAPDTSMMLRGIKHLRFDDDSRNVDIDDQGIRVVNISVYMLEATTKSHFELKQVFDGLHSTWSGRDQQKRERAHRRLLEENDCGFAGELCLEENEMSWTSRLAILSLITGLGIACVLFIGYVGNRRLRIDRASNAIWRIPLSDIKIIKVQHASESMSTSRIVTRSASSSTASVNSRSTYGIEEGEGDGDDGTPLPSDNSTNVSGTHLQVPTSGRRRRDGSGSVRSSRRHTSSADTSGMSDGSITLGALLDTKLRVGRYADQTVVLKPMPLSLSNLNSADERQLAMMRKLQHPNISIFYGFAFGTREETVNAGGTYDKTSSSIPILLMEYGQRGSLRDVLEQDLIKLDAKFKVSITLDIVEGLWYLHNSSIQYHGRLKTTNVIVNKRWVAKLTDYDLLKYRSDLFVSALISSLPEDRQQDVYKKLMFSAPEVLRVADSVLHPDEVYARLVSCFPQADIYSLALCIYELLVEHEPFSEMNISPKDIASRVRSSESSSFRPSLTWDEVLVHGNEGMAENVKRTLVILTKRCWEEQPQNRPTIVEVRKDLHGLATQLYGKRFNLFERILYELEKYTANLEELVRDRTQEVEEEKIKSDRLLQRLLPKPIAERLRAGLSVDAELYASVTIMFVDIVNFTSITTRCQPVQITNLLNTLFSMIDGLVDQHDAYKVETIGSSYMIASGVPTRNGNQHVEQVCRLALEIQHQSSKIVLHSASPASSNKSDIRQQELQLVAGVHTGPCAAGVVGLSMPHYCLFGDAVNTASRMTSTCEPQMIQMSASTHEMLLRHFGGGRDSAQPFYEAVERGTISVKMSALPHNTTLPPSGASHVNVPHNNNTGHHHHAPSTLPFVGTIASVSHTPTAPGDPHVKWHGLLYKYKFTVMKAWWRPCVAALMDDGEFAWHKCSSEDEARGMLSLPYHSHNSSHSSTAVDTQSQQHHTHHHAPAQQQQMTNSNSNIRESSSRTSHSPSYEKCVQLLDLPYGGAVFGETIGKLPPFLTPPMRHLNKTPLTQMFGFHTQPHQVGTVGSATSNSSTGGSSHSSSSQDRLFHHHNDKTYWFCTLNKDDFEQLRNALGVVLLGNAETFHYPLPVDMIRDIWTGIKEPRAFRVVLQDVKQKRLEAAQHDASVVGHGDEELLRRQQAQQAAPHPHQNMNTANLRQSVLHNASHHPPAVAMQQEIG